MLLFNICRVSVGAGLCADRRVKSQQVVNTTLLCVSILFPGTREFRSADMTGSMIEIWESWYFNYLDWLHETAAVTSPNITERIGTVGRRFFQRLSALTMASIVNPPISMLVPFIRAVDDRGSVLRKATQPIMALEQTGGNTHLSASFHFNPKTGTQSHRVCW